FVIFFFSSRRRHTRFSRDWSSDVCSSDLILAYQVDDSLLVNPFQELDEKRMFEIDVLITLDKLEEHEARLQYLEECREKYVFPRSEERRVGKERRCRGWQEQ